MSTTRLSKTRIEHSFSIVPNHITFSNDLTLSEKGALIWLLAKPENYGINQKSLATHWQVGTHTVKRISKKLQETGYLEIQRFATGETIWHLTDTPINPNKPSLDNVELDPQVENRPKGSKQVFEPQVEKPHVENRPALERTDPLVRTDLKKETSSFGNEHECSKVDQLEKEFTRLWSVWPNAKNKIRSHSAFKTFLRGKSLNGMTALIDTLVNDVGKRLKANQLGFSNMMLSTYLNGQRFNDDITGPETVKKNTSDEQQVINDRAKRKMAESRKRFGM